MSIRARPPREEAVTYDWSRVSRETLERLASATDLWAGEFDEQPLHAGVTKDYCRAMAAARTEALVPPLRTRAEVDAEIAREIRESTESGIYCEDCLCPEGGGDNGRAERIRALCREPLAPELNHTDVLQAPGFDGPCFKTRAEARASAAEAADPDPCSCEEALGLRGRIAQLEEMMRNRRIELVATFERALKAEARVRALETP